MRQRRWGIFVMAIGMLLIVSALLLTISNILEEERAGKAADGIMEKWNNEKQDEDNGDSKPESLEEIPDYILDPEMDMPTKEIEGSVCIGYLQIPELDLTLPVAGEWSYSQLKISPCRFSGSVYTDNLIIAAHNYRRHFGSIKVLRVGSEIIFTDVAGNVFHFSVVDIETLQPMEIEKMTSGEWDLTLFTCTIGGQTRVTVRCNRIENQEK